MGGKQKCMPNGKQELMIAGICLPVELLFKAYMNLTCEQWMGTKVVKLETESMGVTSLKPPTRWGTSTGLMELFMRLT